MILGESGQSVEFRLRDVLTKKNPAVLMDSVQITSPLPQLGQLLQLFSDVKIQDLKVSLGQKILFIHYDILYTYNLKKTV